MGILAQKNMLHILALSLFICLFTLQLIFADEQIEKCSACSQEAVNLSPDLKKKTEEIEKALYGKFADKEKQLNQEVILFIDSDSRLSDAAVNNLVKFKQDNPGWEVKGVIAAHNLKDLRQKLLSKRSYFTNDIEFSVDIGESLVRQFDVTATPVYVIIHNGKHYKAMDQSDLNEIISNLKK